MSLIAQIKNIGLIMDICDNQPLFSGVAKALSILNLIFHQEV